MPEPGTSRGAKLPLSGGRQSCREHHLSQAQRGSPGTSRGSTLPNAPTGECAGKRGKSVSKGRVLQGEQRGSVRLYSTELDAAARLEICRNFAPLTVLDRAGRRQGSRFAAILPRLVLEEIASNETWFAGDIDSEFSQSVFITGRRNMT